MIDYITKITLVILVLVILMIISYKLKNISTLNKDKHLQVIDVINVNKNTNIIALQIGQEGVLLGVSPSSVNKIYDLTYEDVNKIKEDKTKIYEKKKIIYKEEQ